MFRLRTILLMWLARLGWRLLSTAYRRRQRRRLETAWTLRRRASFLASLAVRGSIASAAMRLLLVPLKWGLGRC
jgi:hypothetical protein